MRFLRYFFFAAIVAGVTFFAGFQFSYAAVPVNSTFNITGISLGVVLLQPDGKILNGAYNFSFNQVLRFNSDGTADTGYATGSIVNNGIYGMKFQPDGKLLVGGRFTSTFIKNVNCLVRLNSDGTIDTGFDVGSDFSQDCRDINSFAFLTDGSFYVGGSFHYYNGLSVNSLMLLGSGGVRDMSFNIGSGFNALVYNITLQPDGKLLVGGLFTNYNGSGANRLIRLNSNGTIDTGFNIGSGFNGFVRSVVLQPDGKIIAGGGFTDFNGSGANGLIRLNADGSRDTGFNIGSGFNSTVDPVVLQSGGAILVGGFFTDFNGTVANRFVRLLSDGSKDASFNLGSGFNNNVAKIFLSSGDEITLQGNFTDYNGSPVGNFVRMSAPAPADTTPNAFDLGGPLMWFSSMININTDYYSSGVVISGVDSPASISISGGEYSINSGSYTTDASGTVINGDLVVVKLRSAGGYNQTTNATLNIGGVTDTFSITTIPPGGSNGGGGGGGSSTPIDSCPAGDFSPTQYDNQCGTNPALGTGASNTGTNLTGGSSTGNSGASTPGGSATGYTQPEMTDVQAGGICPEGELDGAYMFAYTYQITTMSSCIHADMYGKLFRKDVSKMISNFAIYVMKRQPDMSKKCVFSDMKDADPEYQHYATLACQLGLMGINNATSQPLDLFRKDELLTRAQFAAMLSRLLFGSLYNIDSGETRYVKHMQALVDRNIITKIDPNMIELRGYVMLMLQRVANMR